MTQNQGTPQKFELPIDEMDRATRASAEHQARTPGHHQPKIDGHRLTRMEKRLTPYQQVKRHDRTAHRAEISKAHAQTRGAINMIGMALGKAYVHGRAVAIGLAVGEAGIVAYLCHLAGLF